MTYFNECAWFDRVSSLIDGELPEGEIDLVRSHAKLCVTCGPVLRAELPIGVSSNSRRPDNDLLMGITIVRSSRMRFALGLFGVILIAFAISHFVKGVGSETGIHDLQHLAIWQASLGFSVVVLAVSFRLSLFATATAVFFIVFTSVASIVDIIAGHRGPWLDITHMLEVVILVVLLLLIRPRVKLSRGLQHQAVVRRGLTRIN